MTDKIADRRPARWAKHIWVRDDADGPGQPSMAPREAFALVYKAPNSGQRASFRSYRSDHLLILAHSRKAISTTLPSRKASSYVLKQPLQRPQFPPVSRVFSHNTGWKTANSSQRRQAHRRAPAQKSLIPPYIPVNSKVPKHRTEDVAYCCGPDGGSSRLLHGAK